MASILDRALSAGQIIGLVIGIISAIVSLICCIYVIWYCCKNQNRSRVWSDAPPSYYDSSRAYGRPTSTGYYHQQYPQQQSINRVYEKF